MRHYEGLLGVILLGVGLAIGLGHLDVSHAPLGPEHSITISGVLCGLGAMALLSAGRPISAVADPQLDTLRFRYTASLVIVGLVVGLGFAADGYVGRFCFGIAALLLAALALMISGLAERLSLF